MTGHFEIKDAMAASGNWNVAFAGKDNESSVRFDLDFATDMPPRDSVTGRCTVTDSEFPQGKRIREYPYRFQDTSAVVKLADQRGGVYAPGERHSDAGGARLDTTRSDIMLETLRPGGAGSTRAAGGGAGGAIGAAGGGSLGDSARR